MDVSLSLIRRRHTLQGYRRRQVSPEVASLSLSVLPFWRAGLSFHHSGSVSRSSTVVQCRAQRNMVSAPDMFSFRDMLMMLARNKKIEAMDIYEEMRRSPVDPPISLAFRVILKGLIPFPELREQVKDDFLELSPDMTVYDPAEDLFEDQDSEDD
ncbi:hypothetical protein Peur_036464 [Populus x canadensis]